MYRQYINKRVWLILGYEAGTSMALITIQKKTIQKALLTSGGFFILGVGMGITGTMHDIGILAASGYVVSFSSFFTGLAIYKVFDEKLGVEIFEDKSASFELDNLIEVEQ